MEMSLLVGMQFVKRTNCICTWTMVKRSSVVPVLADLENCKVEQPRESYGHPLCSLEVSEYIQTSLRFKGVMCLEDLAKWTYEDFKRIRGLGPLKIGKILEKLKQYGIETQAELI